VVWVASDTLLDALPDGVVVAGADGLVTHVNAAALRLVEYNGPEPVGRPLGEVMELQDLDGNDWFNCVLPYTGLAVRRRLVECSWRTARGTEVLATVALHRRAPAGSVERVVVGLRDGRSRERVDLARSDLVATVAHADRLSRLIAELLDVARIDAGRLSLRKEPVDLVEAVRRQLEPLSVPGERTISLHGDDRALTWVDRDKFAQVVANLVENGIKHGDGDVDVTIVGAEDGGAELIVDDHGLGVDPDIRPRIFTKFWKQGRGGGSGLGLYIVGGLVAAHDGVVKVEESPSGGARMRVVLPPGRPAGLD